jgi:hypothetical protein
LSDLELAARAVTLDLSALLVESGADGEGLGTVDFGVESVGVEGD